MDTINAYKTKSFFGKDLPLKQGKDYKNIKKKIAKGRIQINHYKKAAPEYIREKK